MVRDDDNVMTCNERGRDMTGSYLDVVSDFVPDSDEAGHSVARVDTAMVERIVSRQGTQPTGDAAVAIHSEAVASLAAEQGVFEGPVDQLER